MVTQNWESAQWLTCHYDVFGQTMCLKKTISKRTFFCVNATSGTWHEDACVFYCCQWHKTAIKALLSNIFIVWTVTYISVTHTKCIVASPLNNGYANVTQWYILCTLPILQYYTSILSTSAKYSLLFRTTSQISKRNMQPTN